MTGQETAHLLGRLDRRCCLSPSRRPARPKCEGAVAGHSQGLAGKAVVLGYQSARHCTTVVALTNGLRVLEGFAERAGLLLYDVYRESDTTGPYSALQTLLVAARRTRAVAVAVPTAMDLGRTSREQHLLGQRIAAAAAVRVLIIAPTPERSGHDSSRTDLR